MTGVLNELTAHGLTVTDIVGGDVGCAGSPLGSNGSHLTATLAADGKDYDIYLLRWRRQSDYEAADPTFQSCVTDYVRTRGSIEVEVVELSPFRAFGGGWSVDAKEAVEQALAAAVAGE